MRIKFNVGDKPSKRELMGIREFKKLDEEAMCAYFVPLNTLAKALKYYLESTYDKTLDRYILNQAASENLRLHMCDCKVIYKLKFKRPYRQPPCLEFKTIKKEKPAEDRYHPVKNRRIRTQRKAA